MQWSIFASYAVKTSDCLESFILSEKNFFNSLSLFPVPDTVSGALSLELVGKYKYLIAYLAPISALAGIYFLGWASLGAIYIGFLIIPLIEGIWFPDPTIHNKPTGESNHSGLHDLFLYLNIPILYAVLLYFLYTVSFRSVGWAEMLALILNVGLVLGVTGINVAHELGHRKEKHHHWMAWALLLPSFYLHFFIEHNKGHHRYIATLEDPATARKNETIFSFWIRSIRDSYLHAWHLEWDRMKRTGQAAWGLKNLMVVFSIVQLAYIGLIAISFGIYPMLWAGAVGLVGLLFLESVNYIEHYGLMREIKQDGSYGPIHEGLSWDADQPLGRIFLYELTRHADHHTNASKPYQVLQASYQSPKMAYGYPASIVIALIPPLWFRIMNPRIPLQNVS
jgi:alkane 1-monooxygenase